MTAYVYASEVEIDREGTSSSWVPVSVAFCPVHFHTIAMQRDRAAAERVAASHNHIHHPEVRVQQTSPRPKSGRSAYFDLNSGQIRSHTVSGPPADVVSSPSSDISRTSLVTPAGAGRGTGGSSEVLP